MRPLVAYHANCQDGWCSAWVAHRALGDDVDYVPVHYGTPPPDITGRDVYVLDFSFKRPVMIDLSQRARKLVLLDHHQSAVDELQGLSAGSNEGLIRLDVTKAGCRLTWEYFFQNQPAPWLVRMVEDRDLWKFSLPYSREVNAALVSYPVDFPTWDWLYRCLENGAPRL